ncbi:hypothetical protein V8E36_003734 [Tilletia maclaganii]
MKKGSLAAQLALLDDVAPVEDAQADALQAFPLPQRGDDDGSDHDESREDQDGEESGGEEEDDDDEDEDEEEGSDDGAPEEDQDVDDDADLLDSDLEDDENEGLDDDDLEDEDDEDATNGPAQGALDGSALASQALESAALMQSLKAETQLAAERGRAIKRQQRDWDSALELRIRAQKLIRGPMRIQPQSVGSLLDSTQKQDEQANFLRQLDSLSASLFLLRARLLVRSEMDELELPDLVSVERLHESRERARKRQKVGTGTSADIDEEAQESHDDSVKKLLALENEVLQPLTSTVLNATHAKVNAATASAAASKATAKFKSTTQTPVEQIEATLSNAESRRKLVERTQVWRGDEALLRAEEADGTKNSDVDGEDAATAEPSLAGQRALEVDIFDDSDMYAQLLRELIESKGCRSSTSALPSAGSRFEINADLTLLAPSLLNGGKKLKRTVDTRASKGRKIRYEVNEKIANFMPPVPRLLWDDEQIDRLFSKLNTRLGDHDVVKRTAAVGGAADEEGVEDEEEERAAEETNVIDGLQLFG